MGHQRLGTLPRSKAWREVVALLASGAAVEQVAASAARAAESSMIDASKDPAVRYAFWMLARLPLAARDGNFRAALGALGLKVSEDPLLADIVCAVMEAVDRHAMAEHARSDFGELAQLSAAESLQAVVSREMQLFGADTQSVKDALGSFATVKQFAVLARDYFSRLTRGHINYFLSREISRHVGPGKRFASVREHRAFEEALDLHCRETSRIIKEYAGEWFSKHNFEGGIDQWKAGRFVDYASRKIRDELRRRREAPAYA